MREKYKAVIVGSGMMGVQHTLALRRIPGVEVVGICDPVCPDIERRARELAIPHACRDYEKMLEELAPDVVHNCTPNSEHYGVSKKALERGIAVYSEKPLAVSLEQAEELTALAAKNRVPNGVNFNYRSNAMVREMRARLRQGDPGKVLLVHGAYLQDWLMYEDDFNWRVDSRIGGASRAVADIGSHWFDTVQTVLDAKIEAVYAKLLTVYGERKKSLAGTETFKEHTGSDYESVKVDTEDAGFIMMRFAGGVYGNLVLSQVSGGYKNAMQFSIDCANCSLRWEQETPDRIVIGDRRVGEVKVLSAAGANTGDANDYTSLPGGHPVGWADALANNIGLFYKAVRNGTAMEPGQEYADFASAGNIMRLVDACLESNAKDAWVTLQ